MGVNRRTRAPGHGNRPTLWLVRDTIEEVEALDLPDGAHWALIHDKLGLEYGEVFDIMVAYPDFFGINIEPRGGRE